MWEDLTIALSCVGFVAAVVLLVVELPPVLAAAQEFARQHRQER
jgi:hypothetical protein